ncbi:serine/threonine-protein kinase [Actinomycetospora sp. CA-101289]|uniref:serine/threonine-protein kinase n=1 Tax=Actinomycetospora sp. CA-101289 TaxID=3239893 RepID=UPI003D986B0D
MTSPEWFGRYRLEVLLGQGGMGEVYRAHDTTADRRVALKLLTRELSTDERFRARFRRECQVAAQLSEPHIVPIHGYGEIDGRLYLDMRLVEGAGLDSVLAARGRLVPERAVSVVAQIASALDAAHQDGLHHRDVKPSNILLTGPQREFAYLLDFGISRRIDDVSRHTSTGTLIGTFAYMAPERFTARDTDHRVDVYALACVLHECLTGSPPFAGEDLPSVMHAHFHAPRPRASLVDARVPTGLDDVVARGLAVDPAARFPSAGALADAAGQALAASVPGWPTPPVAPAPAVVPVAAAGATWAPSSQGAWPLAGVPGTTALPEPVAVSERPRRPVPWFVVLGGDVVLLLVLTLVVVLALTRG